MDINKKGFGAAPSDNAAQEKSFIYCPDDKKRGLFDCPAYLFRGRVDIGKGSGKRITVVAEGDVKVTLFGKEVHGSAEMLLNDQA